MNHIRRSGCAFCILGGLAIIGLFVGPSVALAQQVPLVKEPPTPLKGAIGGITVTAQGQGIGTLAAGGKPPADVVFFGHSGGSFETGFANMFISLGPIPVGRRLVIEHVGVECALDGDDEVPRVRIWVFQIVGSSWSYMPVPIPVATKGINAGNQGIFTVAQPLRLYSDGTDLNIAVEVWHNKNLAAGSCYTHVSGYTTAMQ